jgi:hypothetical protein
MGGLKTCILFKTYMLDAYAMRRLSENCIYNHCVLLLWLIAESSNTTIQYSRLYESYDLAVSIFKKSGHSQAGIICSILKSGAS